MHIKKLFIVLAIVCFSASLSFANGTQEGGEELPILGAGIYSATDNFNSFIGKAIVKASNGVFDTNIDDGQFDQANQNNQIDTMLAKGASCIAISLVDITAAGNVIQKCKDAGDIPIIFFNKEVTDQELLASYGKCYQVTSTGGTYGADIQGQLVAEYWMAHPEADKNSDGKMQIINLMGDPGHTASMPRSNGVKDAITSAGIELDILEEDTGMWDTAKAKEKMDAWISKFGNEIEFIICANDAMALGSLASIEAAGFNISGTDSEKYIPVIGIDALPEMLSKIESGEVMGSVLQDATTQGTTIVKMASNLVAGKDVLDGMSVELEAGAKAVRVPYTGITKENISTAEECYGN
ncbi:MAG: galactose ABC transporter substrate-binding protein [Spirochaetales bacterium]|nr:galactose ABC transporter substrate-binding protein [Spirochaetales bacterium]